MRRLPLRRRGRPGRHPVPPCHNSGLRKPALILGGDNSCVTGACRPSGASERAALDAARAMLIASTGQIWRFTIAGMARLNFTDYGVYYLAAPLRRAIGLGAIGGRRGLAITADYLGAFVDRVVQRRAGTLLDGSSRPYPEVTAITG